MQASQHTRCGTSAAKLREPTDSCPGNEVTSDPVSEQLILPSCTLTGGSLGQVSHTAYEVEEWGLQEKLPMQGKKADVSEHSQSSVKGVVLCNAIGKQLCRSSDMTI